MVLKFLEENDFSQSTKVFLLTNKVVPSIRPKLTFFGAINIGLTLFSFPISKFLSVWLRHQLISCEHKGFDLFVIAELFHWQLRTHFFSLAYTLCSIKVQYSVGHFNLCAYFSNVEKKVSTSCSSNFGTKRIYFAKSKPGRALVGGGTKFWAFVALTSNFFNSTSFSISAIFSLNSLSSLSFSLSLSLSLSSLSLSLSFLLNSSSSLSFSNSKELQTGSACLSPRPKCLDMARTSPALVTDGGTLTFHDLQQLADGISLALTGPPLTGSLSQGNPQR